MTLPQYCQIIFSKAQRNNEPLLSQAIWRDTILKHIACTRSGVARGHAGHAEHDQKFPQK